MAYISLDQVVKRYQMGEVTITAADHIQNVDYNPYEGIPARGNIHQVYLRGTLAVDRGQVLAGPDGQFIPRGRSVL